MYCFSGVVIFCVFSVLVLIPIPACPFLLFPYVYAFPSLSSNIALSSVLFMSTIPSVAIFSCCFSSSFAYLYIFSVLPSVLSTTIAFFIHSTFTVFSVSYTTCGCV